MLICLSIAGIILSVILLYFNARRYQSTLYLGLFFLVISLYGINQYVLLYSKSVVLVALIVTNISFAFYLIGPLLYWYIRSILTDNSRLKKSDLLHIIPMIIYLVAALPYMLSPFSHKLEVAKEIINDLGFLSNYNFTVLSEVFSNTAVYLSRPLLALGYTLWAIGIFLRYLTQREKIIVLSGQIFMMKWLAVFLGFQLLLIASHLCAIFITFTAGSDVFFTLNALQLLSAAGMIGLLSSPFFFPSILYGLPQIPDSFFRKRM